MKIFWALIKQFAFWIVFFAITRTIYILYNLRYFALDDIGFGETLASYYHGFQLDLATACYFLIIPFFILLIQSFTKAGWLNTLNKIYMLLVIIVYSLITTTELGIYEEWKTKLHYKAIMYITHPTEIYNSAETSTFFLLMAILVIQIVVSFWLYRRFFFKPILISKRNYIYSLLFLLISPVLLFLGMRGGVQEIPINQSESYFSEHNILNLASVNSGFNLFISLFENWGTAGKNPYISFKNDEIERILNEVYYTPADSTPEILTTKRPNIVVVLLESWSADLIQSLGGEPDITPKFHELEEEGILFTEIYASGSRSEQGMASLLSGFPAHPLTSITVQPDKYNGLPTITNVLENNGYFTSFYFGGQLIYGNIKSYILYNGFNRIIEISDFPDDFPQGKLGVHDEFLFQRQLEETGNDPQPFFSMIYTLSTHSPFDMPMEKKIHWGGHVNMYLNSAWYTDSCLYTYLQQAKQEPWYDSTLFVIVADHSHNSQKNWNYYTKEYHRIPLLFYGNVIKPEYRGKQCTKIGSQVDIAAMLLKQMDLDSGQFHWSKNLLNSHSPQFAYTAFEEGIGWVRPEGDFYYDKKLDHFYSFDVDSLHAERIVKEGKAFLQAVFREYMEY